MSETDKKGRKGKNLIYSVVRRGKERGSNQEKMVRLRERKRGKNERN